MFFQKFLIKIPEKSCRKIIFYPLDIQSETYKRDSINRNLAAQAASHAWRAAECNPCLASSGMQPMPFQGASLAINARDACLKIKKAISKISYMIAFCFTQRL